MNNNQLADALRALKSEALGIFNGPETSQEVRDAIEWYAASVAVAIDKAAPIDMVLHCPACSLQHIDAPESMAPKDQPQLNAEWCAWTNPPHRSHLCHGCGHVWRPADVPTNGVKTVETAGQNDSPIAPSERDRLRAAQTVAVMSLIGPLLDAWEGIYGDVKGAIRVDAPGLVRQLVAINKAMETAGDDHDQAGAEKGVCAKCGVYPSEPCPMPDPDECIQRAEDDAPAADPIRELIGKHAALVADDGEFPYYCYFELAYTRHTGWMAWLCSKPREDDPGRKVIASGQGQTPDDACREALVMLAKRATNGGGQ